jgi:hypothetical protein
MPGRKKAKRKNKRGANGGHSDHQHPHSAQSSFSGDDTPTIEHLVRQQKSASPDMRYMRSLPKVDETVTSPTEAKLKIDAQIPENKHKDGGVRANIAAEVAKELGQRILEATKENVPPPQSLRGSDFCPLLDQFTLEEAEPISIGKVRNPAAASMSEGFPGAQPDFAPLSNLVMSGASGYSSFLDSFKLPSTQKPMHANDEEEEDEWADAEPEFRPDNRAKIDDLGTAQKEYQCPFSKALVVEEECPFSKALIVEEECPFSKALIVEEEGQTKV